MVLHNHPELTIREFAELERVHERTVRLWIHKGALRVRRTPGGRIRIPRAESAVAMLALQHKPSK
jgi:excisionase family DNA binding protein